MDVVTTTIDVERPESKPPLPDPQPINTSPVKFKVLTQETMPEGEFVYFAMDTRSYETMARNMADILRWVKEAQWRLQYYRGEGGIDQETEEP